MSDIKDTKTLSEAIAKLEKVGQTKTDDLKNILEKDFNELKKTIDDLKPQFEDFKSKVESQVGKSKSDLESQMTKNPWVTLAMVGIIGFILGCFFNSTKKDEPK